MADVTAYVLYLLNMMMPKQQYSRGPYLLLLVLVTSHLAALSGFHTYGTEGYKQRNSSRLLV
jgi:hypothetical protein